MQYQDILIAFSVVFLWAINLIVLKVFGKQVSLEFFNLLRFLCFVPLLVIFYRRPPTAFFKLFMVSIFWNVGNFFFLGLGVEHGIGAGVIAVVYQLCTFFGVLFCFLFLREIPKTHQIMGMLLAFLGVILLFNDFVAQNTNMLGLVYILLAAMCWGIGIALFKKYQLSCDLPTNAWLCSIAVIPMFAILYVRGGYPILEDSVLHLSTNLILAVLFGAYVAMLLCGSLWMWLLQKYPASLITPFMFLLPPFSCILSHFYLGERFTSLQILSFMIILFGISINQNLISKLINHKPVLMRKRWISIN